MLLLQVIMYRPTREPGKFGCGKNDKRLEPMIAAMVRQSIMDEGDRRINHLRTVTPIAQAKRYDVLRMPNPTIRLQTILTTPAGMFNNADFLLLKPRSLIKVVE